MPPSHQIIAHQKEIIGTLQREVQELDLENKKLHAAIRGHHLKNTDEHIRGALAAAAIASKMGFSVAGKIDCEKAFKWITMERPDPMKEVKTLERLLKDCAKVALWNMGHAEPEGFCPDFMSEVDDDDDGTSAEEATRVYFQNAIYDADS